MKTMKHNLKNLHEEIKIANEGEYIDDYCQALIEELQQLRADLSKDMEDLDTDVWESAQIDLIDEILGDSETPEFKAFAEKYAIKEGEPTT